MSDTHTSQNEGKSRFFDTFRPPWSRRKPKSRPFDTMRPPAAGAATSADVPTPETFAPRPEREKER